MTLRRRTLLAAIGVLTITAGVSLAQQFRQPGRESQSVPLPEDRAGVADWKVDQNFKKDVFTFVRIEYDSDGGYGGRGRFGRGGFGPGGFGRGGGGGGRRGGRRGGGGWLTDWPDSDLNFSFRLQQLTSLKVNPQPINMRLTDEQLRDYPFIYIIEPGRLSFSPEEGACLRQYLLNGGFLMVDDFWGQEELDNFLGQMKLHVFPEDRFTPNELPFEHEIFRCVYPGLKQKPQVPSIQTWRWGQGITWEDHGENSEQVHYMGIEDDKGRLMAIICHNTDLGDGWEREGENEQYFRDFSQKLSYPMGINIVTYAMTH